MDRKFDCFSYDPGKPLVIYLDKFSTYKVNHKNAVDNKDFQTQFQRAMNELGIKIIFAHTPQAKGRVEKMNSTFQDRLIKEMRLAKIDNINDEVVVEEHLDKSIHICKKNYYRR